MNNGHPPQFYEDIGRIKTLVEEIPALKEDIRRIDKKVTMITAWASGVGATAGLLFTFIKDFWNKFKDGT